MAEAPKEWAEMTADALREAAVLVLVFGLLDKYLTKEGPSDAWTSWVVGLAAVGFVVGGVIERSRRK